MHIATVEPIAKGPHSLQRLAVCGVLAHKLIGLLRDAIEGKVDIAKIAIGSAFDELRSRQRTVGGHLELQAVVRKPSEYVA